MEITLMMAINSLIFFPFELELERPAISFFDVFMGVFRPSL